MSLKKYLVFLGFAFVIIMSCSSDDDGDNVILVEDRDRTEQQAADRDSLLSYLSSHYYNSAALAAIDNPVPSDIVITELEDGASVPEGHTLLADAENLETKTTTYEDADYEYYILKLNQGGGEASPNFTDRVRSVYEGSLVTDGSIFDSTVTPADSNLVGFDLSNARGAITGWSLVFPEFNIAEGFDVDDQGATQFRNYGLGVMFLPSGLAYFSLPRTGIPAYSNLIFKFSLLQTEVLDHDNDGVPSYIENRNNNQDAFDDDTDGDEIPDFLDVDDDGDETPTLFEDLDEDEDPTNDDSDGDGTPNYLDTDSTASNQDG